MALPTIEALAASERTLTVLARPHLVPLLGLTSAVTAVVEKAGEPKETIRRLGSGTYDEAVILTNSFSGAWLPLRARIPVRWGYRSDFRSPLLKPAVPRPRGRHHQLRDYDRLLEAMGVRAPVDPPLLGLAAETEAIGRQALERAGIDPSRRPLVGLFVGAEFGPSKRWPAERFGETARRLRRLVSGARPVLLAGPSEAPLAADLHRATDGVFPVLGPNLDLAGLAGLLAQLDLLVTNDTGPMHLGAAVGTPCVALFGPTDPGRTAPCGDGHRVLYENRWCSPCFRRRCPLIHHRCLKDIGVEAVIAASSDILGRAGYSIS
jgi:heptosyltransferase-2